MVEEERGRDGACSEPGVANEPAEEGQIGRHAFDYGLVERQLELRERLVPVGAVGDQLGDHRVVREADLVALLDSRIDPERRRGGRGG